MFKGSHRLQITDYISSFFSGHIRKTGFYKFSVDRELTEQCLDIWNIRGLFTFWKSDVTPIKFAKNPINLQNLQTRQSKRKKQKIKSSC